MTDVERTTSAHMATLLLLAFPWLDGLILDTGCCVIFMGQRNANGYGRAPRHPYGPKWPYVHRLLWLIAYGDPGDSTIDHICGVRACIRLDHLRLLSRSENSRQGALRRHRGPSEEHRRHLDCQRLSEAHSRPPVTARGREGQARTEYVKAHPQEFTEEAVGARWRLAYDTFVLPAESKEFLLAHQRLLLASALPEPLRTAIVRAVVGHLLTCIGQDLGDVVPPVGAEAGEHRPRHPRQPGDQG